MLPILHEVVPCKSIVRKQPAKRGVSEECRHWIGEPATAVLQTAIWVEQLRRHDAHFWMTLQIDEQARKGSGMHDGVGIEWHRMRSLSNANGVILTTCKSEIL